MDIKILVATHKKYWFPEDDVYVPIQVGREGKASLNYIEDNTGDNISGKNPNYCELTGLYWAWKNLSADYVGLVHYRRYFTRKNHFTVGKKRESILKKSEIEQLLLDADIILPDKRKYYIETNRSHYNHSHYKKDMDMTEQIIKVKYPDYSPAFELVMNRTWAHMFNMFIMKKVYFDEYCEWLFDILFVLEKRTDLENYNPVESRIFGYISELLLDVWIETRKLDYKEVNVSFMEPQNWIKKGGTFLKRKMFS